MNQSEQHGQHTLHSSREEEWEKEQRKESLYNETYQDSGSVKGKDRIIYFENSYHQRDPFVIKEVTTVPELLQKICDRFPEICCETLQLRIFQNRMGTTGRKEILGNLPSEADTLYISFALRKHPVLAVLKK